MSRTINVETPVRNNETVDRALKRFSRKVKKEGIIDSFRERRYYEKPSDKKRRLAKRRRQILRRLKQKEETI